MTSFRHWTIIASAIFHFAGGHALAAEVAFGVTDQNGKPADNAVVSLTPEFGAAPYAAPAGPWIIDQQNVTFLPLVTIVPRGGQAIFTNNDRTRHHVYSFSGIKKFDLVLSPGQKSSPVTFDQEGVAIIGCNIHDGMIAYAYVSVTPFTELTGADGRATIARLGSGTYQARVWHPRMKPGAEPPAQKITVGTASVEIKFSVPLMPERSRSTHHRSY